MKTLFIVRHAKSSWSEPSLSDFDRPLNKRGRKNSPDMGQRLKAQNILPDLIISSPAKRAITTAEVIAQEIGYGASKIIKDQNLFHANSRSIIRLLSLTSNVHNSIMIFGHNPGLTYLINDLSDTYLDNLPTCAVCGIQFETDTWEDIAVKKGVQFFYDFPKSNDK